MKLSSRGMGIATILTMALITGMTVWGELSAGFKEALTGMTGHHWVSKGVISLVAFVALSLALGTVFKDSDPRKTSYAVAASSILLAAVIFAFYLYEFFLA